MGSPKQLLPWGRGTLLQASLSAVLAAPFATVTVVLGARASEVQSSWRDWPEAQRLQVVINENWAQGMATSLILGVRNLLALEAQKGPFSGLAVCLGDMPTLNPALLERLLREAEQLGPEAIVAPVCSGKRGHPVIIGRAYWEEMLGLSGDQGAAPVLRRHSDRLVLLPADSSVSEDVDTPEQWRELRERMELYSVGWRESSQGR